MNERRKYRRFVLKDIDVYAKTLYDNEIEVLDLSSSGALITSSKRFNMGGNYLFKFEHNHKVFSIKCSVVRSTLSSSKVIGEGETMPIYTTGLTFKDMSAGEDAQLTEFISETVKSLRKQKLDSLQLIIHLEKALLCYMGTHSIKDISEGGIRIETEGQPLFDPVFDMEIFLSENEPPINTRGRAAYSQELKEENAGNYSVGIEFIDIREDDLLRIKGFLADLP